MSRHKDRSSVKREVAAVAGALYQHWNPIAVGDLPPHEYDAYAPSVVSLLHPNADDTTIGQHLAMLEEQQFSLPPRPLPELTRVAALVRSAATHSRGT